MNEALKPWTCPRCESANEGEAMRCPSCGDMRVRGIEAGMARRRCLKCFYVFSGSGGCPICASMECEDVE